MPDGYAMSGVLSLVVGWRQGVGQEALQLMGNAVHIRSKSVLTALVAPAYQCFSACEWCRAWKPAHGVARCLCT